MPERADLERRAGSWEGLGDTLDLAEQSWGSGRVPRRRVQGRRDPREDPGKPAERILPIHRPARLLRTWFSLPAAEHAGDGDTLYWAQILGPPLQVDNKVQATVFL